MSPPYQGETRRQINYIQIGPVVSDKKSFKFFYIDIYGGQVF